MKKMIFLMAVLCCLLASSFAQDKKTVKKAFVSLAAQTSLAVGDLAETHGLGLGLSVQGGYRITNNLALTARASYTYLFGKKYSSDYYIPGDPGGPGGGGGSYNGKYDGMNDFGFTGGIRYTFPGSHIFGGLEGGLCIDAGEGESETAGMFSCEGGYEFYCKMEQAIALFMGLCGDPKIQVGLRYSIRF